MNITSIGRNTNVVTVVTDYNHAMTTGDTVVVEAVNTTFNGTFTVTVTGDQTFTYPQTGVNVGAAPDAGLVRVAIFTMDDDDWKAPLPNTSYTDLSNVTARIGVLEKLTASDIES